jgi:predicted YcjX-like family ATPase
MPTTRPRHVLTETDELSDALDKAARVWPELHDDRAALLRRLVDEGTHTVAALDAKRRQTRLSAIRETAGMFTGMWPADAVQQMREEWPE